MVRAAEERARQRARRRARRRRRRRGRRSTAMASPTFSRSRPRPPRGAAALLRPRRRGHLRDGGRRGRGDGLGAWHRRHTARGLEPSLRRSAVARPPSLSRFTCTASRAAAHPAAATDARLSAAAAVAVSLGGAAAGVRRRLSSAVPPMPMRMGSRGDEDEAAKRIQAIARGRNAREAGPPMTEAEQRAAAKRGRPAQQRLPVRTRRQRPRGREAAAQRVQQAAAVQSVWRGADRAGRTRREI